MSWHAIKPTNQPTNLLCQYFFPAFFFSVSICWCSDYIVFFLPTRRDNLTIISPIIICKIIFFSLFFLFLYLHLILFYLFQKKTFIFFFTDKKFCFFSWTGWDLCSDYSFTWLNSSFLDSFQCIIVHTLADMLLYPL